MSTVGQTRASAVVIGLDDARGVYAARTLARRKVPLIGVASDPLSYGSKTNSCRQVLYGPTRGVELVELLEDLGPKLGEKAVLFPCFDQTVITLSRFRDRLEPWFHVVLPSADAVECMTDKVKFHEYATSAGLPVPKGYVLRTRVDAELAAQQLAFPCVLKPTTSKSPDWLKHTHLKAFKASNGEELLSSYDRLHRWTEALIVQEWIRGTDANLYSCNCYFDSRSQAVASVISRKVRQWPPETGETSMGEECREDTVLSESVRFFEGFKHRGLGYVEFKRDDRTGRYLIVEPNIGRPTARSAIAEASGVELLYAMYCDAAGLELPEGRTQSYQGVKWVHLRKDLQSSIHYWRRGELTLGSWLKSYRGRKVFALFSWRDPRPFWADLYRVARLYLNPSERKKRTAIE